MVRTINAKQLRASKGEGVRRVRRGGGETALEEDPIYRALAVGRSSDGRAARDHDRVLYSAPGARKRCRKG